MANTNDGFEEDDLLVEHKNDVEEARLYILHEARLNMLFPQIAHEARQHLLFPQIAHAMRLQKEQRQRQYKEAQQGWDTLIQKHMLLHRFSSQCVKVTKETFAQERERFLENINKDLHHLFEIPRELKQLKSRPAGV